ncbi:lytic polysaccharide monooxygenase auxiliary activity family 9 protein [Streptomyces vinaceus]|uniref:lytic polysaccharide monooxygenase auxiliary activity family 9 protein n=1 Tax=Streptomyces vinaceus TaxID=1960 RepID=UPI0035D685DD
MSDLRLSGPRNLVAEVRYRDDGKYTMYGVSLRWQIGRNDPELDVSVPPADWDEGRAPYPHVYEVWLNDELRQTVFLHWSSHDWTQSNSHWVDLGEAEPDGPMEVKIRAKVGDEFTPFTNEVHLRTEAGSAQKWAAHESGRTPPPAVQEAGARHGTAHHPRSRAAVAFRDFDSSKICAEARRRSISTDWSEVGPDAARMIESCPWNSGQKYLEYRKFFEEGTLASAGNTAFSGLDLAPGDTLGEWPLTVLDSRAPTHTFSYDYMGYHWGESWSHRWFITRAGWKPSDGLGWKDLDPVPFLVEVHGSPRAEESTSWEFASLPRRSGQAAIVGIWGGNGGPDTYDGGNGGKTGEFFVSVCDVMLR